MLHTLRIARRGLKQFVPVGNRSRKRAPEFELRTTLQQPRSLRAQPQRDRPTPARYARAEDVRAQFCRKDSTHRSTEPLSRQGTALHGNVFDEAAEVPG